ncbi:hypothetical protein ACE1MK_13160 [Tenacibaculum maritimum]|uniref:hypothetical protein n=1 Tax=Tenacibaculum maritimum TaxID=107401 RepID=UPI0012E5ED48|nr:hypothetical protein [Tenacibaculum maritimum]MCD9583430.1 hypothetical protein [Tenacibaculum maritimum]MCD9637500.1 hypothetical protein [Tenacibaculum maritimum]MDB0601449.1 hypothetical protein [Tenacibaculum maritimum]MDB0613007.1 hypothetical protein [Tenacibaculum maritimum]CAA0149691.1 conserved hypothetical protein [Tenacibaculum maritimum]
MKKGYYLTYGFLSKDLHKAVNFIEKKIRINLDSENVYDDELYILGENNRGNFPIIDNFTIHNNFGNSYFKEDGTTVKDVNYLISCNIVSGSEDLKNESIEYVRKELLHLEELIELNFDFNEWE